MKKTRTLTLFLVAAAMLIGCGDDDDNNIGGEDVETIYDVEGNWVGETRGGQRFTMRLNQRGTAVTGDVTINEARGGAAGRIEGNRLTLEINLEPRNFLVADIGEGVLVNGRITDAAGGVTGAFVAERQ